MASIDENVEASFVFISGLDVRRIISRHDEGFFFFPTICWYVDSVLTTVLHSVY